MVAVFWQWTALRIRGNLALATVKQVVEAPKLFRDERKAGFGKKRNSTPCTCWCQSSRQQSLRRQSTSLDSIKYGCLGILLILLLLILLVLNLDTALAVVVSMFLAGQGDGWKKKSTLTSANTCNTTHRNICIWQALYNKVELCYYYYVRQYFIIPNLCYYFFR